jgi:F420-non-reducing hydrogenase iron-sulfur subunit
VIAEKRAEAIRLILDDLGIEQGRFRVEWVSSAEGPRFAQIVNDFTEQIKKLGPNPNKIKSEAVVGIHAHP